MRRILLAAILSLLAVLVIGICSESNAQQPDTKMEAYKFLLSEANDRVVQANAQIATLAAENAQLKAEVAKLKGEPKSEPKH